MKSAENPRRVFFEPWSLGDVVIAAAALRELAEPAILACHSMWHPLLRVALAEIPDLELVAVDLPYTTRRRGNPFDTGARPGNLGLTVSKVLSIRGDLRDFAAARRLFPHARVRMRGWVRFFGRKNALVNLPYAHGILPARNRYRSWARLSGVRYEKIEQTYRARREIAPRNRRAVIHLGAQWRSKQYPDVAALREAFAERGYEVEILAGPNDPLPAALKETEIRRAINVSLIHALRSAEQVITNDSGPMHLAAFLGCRTTALVRTSPIEEWAPPATTIVRSPLTPRGYRPHANYMSDEILTGWPKVEEIVARALA